MSQQRKKDSIYEVTSRILLKLDKTRSTSATKAILSNLRRSLGRPLSQTIEIWSLLYEELPESFLTDQDEPTTEEKAILNALQLYAIHQQGNKDSVLLWDQEGIWNNLGYSLQPIRDRDSRSTDQRFNGMIASDSFDELSYHIRQLIKLLKASKSKRGVNYARLAEDFYWFIRGQKEKVRLNWARAYYSYQPQKEEDSNDNQ